MLGFGLLFATGAFGGGPHGSPKAVFEASRDAFLAADWGRIWDLTAPSLRAEAERKFSSQKLQLEHDPEKKKGMLATIGVPPGEFQRMSARDLFVRMMQKGFSAGGGFGGEMARLRSQMADADVESVVISGDRAVVRVSYGGRKDQLRMVRENGDWYLSTSF